MLQLGDLAERARLIGELQSDGIALALPLRAGNIDLLAWTDPPGAWVPITVATMGAVAGIMSRRFTQAAAPGLYIAVIDDDRARPAAKRTFAFTPAELLMVKMVETIERARRANGKEQPQSSQALEMAIRHVIDPFGTAAGQWRRKLAAVMAHRAGGTGSADIQTRINVVGGVRRRGD